MFLRKLKPFNRRKDPRYEPKASLPVSLVHLAPDGSVREVTPEIINISKGGVFLMTTEKKILPGTRIELRFNLPGNPVMQRVFGKVTRTYRRHKESWYYSGVKFEFSDPGPIRTLLSYLADISP
jgi:hypothetical protein